MTNWHHGGLDPTPYVNSNPKTGLVNNTAVNQCRLKVYLAPNSPSDTSSEADSESDSEPKTKAQPPLRREKYHSIGLQTLASRPVTR